MTQTDHLKVTRYLARVRRGLSGLPAADVNDTIEEMRGHLFEEIGERGDVDAVIADFGDAAEVASRIVSDRVRPAGGTPVAEASVGRRYSAWATDVVIGLGPLVMVPTIIAIIGTATGFPGIPGTEPIWFLMMTSVLERWVMSPQELASMPLADRTVIPAWQWMLLAALILWALYYWLVLRRKHSSSVGMWMTGLRGVRTDDDRLIVRERDISQHPAPLGTGRNRWWILLAAVPAGCWCILLVLFYLTVAIGSFVQPWDVLREPFDTRADLERTVVLGEEFIAAIEDGEQQDAYALVAQTARDEVDELLDLARDPEFERAEIVDVGDTLHLGLLMLSTNETGQSEQREVTITIGKTQSVDGHVYTTAYRIEDIEIDPESETSP